MNKINSLKQNYRIDLYVYNLSLQDYFHGRMGRTDLSAFDMRNFSPFCFHYFLSTGLFRDNIP